MMITTVISLAFLLQIETAKVRSFVATSTLVDVGRMVAKDEGFNVPELSRNSFFDLPQGPEPVKGSASIIFYGEGAHPIHMYSIDLTTGQVVDANACKVFKFSDLREFERTVQKETGSKPKSDEELAAEVGCAQLEVVDKASVTRAMQRESKRAKH